MSFFDRITWQTFSDKQSEIKAVWHIYSSWVFIRVDLNISDQQTHEAGPRRSDVRQRIALRLCEATITLTEAYILPCLDRIRTEMRRQIHFTINDCRMRYTAGRRQSFDELQSDRLHNILPSYISKQETTQLSSRRRTACSRRLLLLRQTNLLGRAY